MLVRPTKYSLWINMQTILDELVHSGPEVIVLTSSASMFAGPNKSSAIKFEIYPISSIKNNIMVCVFMYLTK